MCSPFSPIVRVSLNNACGAPNAMWLTTPTTGTRQLIDARWALGCLPAFAVNFLRPLLVLGLLAVEVRCSGAPLEVAQGT